MKLVFEVLVIKEKMDREKNFKGEYVLKVASKDKDGCPVSVNLTTKEKVTLGKYSGDFRTEVGVLQENGVSKAWQRLVVSNLQPVK